MFILTCRSFHRWTRWSPSLIERDEGWQLTVIEDILWRMCMRCGAQEEWDLSCE